MWSGSHGRRGIRHTLPLDRTGIIGGHGLPLDDGRALNAKAAGRGGRSRTKDTAHRRTLADFMNHGDDAVDVPPFEGAGFHQHAESRAGLDGIKPIIVLKTVTEDDFVQVIHAAMRTVRPDGFILRLLGHEFAVFIHANTGTFHNAAAVTAMSGIAGRDVSGFPPSSRHKSYPRLQNGRPRNFLWAIRLLHSGY